jgi:DNA-binding MarR family transcriptional regulator
LKRPVKSATGLDLQRYVPALISVLENKLTNTASAVYRRHFGIGATEMRIVVQLGQRARMSGSQIGQAAALDKAAVSRALKSLRSLGLITVTAASGRTKAISLTRSGEALYEKGVTISRLREQYLLAGLSAAERELAVRLLTRMLDNMPLVSGATMESHPAMSGRLAPATAPI